MGDFIIHVLIFDKLVGPVRVYELIRRELTQLVEATFLRLFCFFAFQDVLIILDAVRVDSVLHLPEPVQGVLGFFFYLDVIVNFDALDTVKLNASIAGHRHQHVPHFLVDFVLGCQMVYVLVQREQSDTLSLGNFVLF